MSYTDIFGGRTVSPSQLSYVSFNSAVDLELEWPLEAAPDELVAADKIDVRMTVASKAVVLPPANQVSVGQDVLIRNTGSITFSVEDFDGAEVGSIASGEAWYFVLTDNSTEAGEWYAVEFGAGTSSATAASLAGAGLRAASNKLDQNLITTGYTGDQAITSANRADVLQNNGGVAEWELDPIATMGNGWFCYIINAGNGNLTLRPDGSETIDGESSKVLIPGESLILFSNGTNFHTVGYGRALVSVITASIIDVAGSGTQVLTGVQKAAQIQNYVGTLTGNRNVNFDADIGYWFVVNETTGAFDLKLRVNGLDSGAIIPQGTFSIVRSNGTNLDVALTAPTGTVTNVATGAGLTGGPITSTGTISMLDTAVTPGAYGGADKALALTVNSRGQLTAMAEGDIAIDIDQVNVMTSAELQARVSDETGTGALVFATAPALGTPTSLTLTNATGLPVSTGIAGLAAGVAAFLATPTSANLATAVTDETGTGALAFANAPTLVNPVVGTQAQNDNSTKAASTAYVDRIGVQQITATTLTTYLATAGTGIPFDNSEPQITEGDEVMTIVVTPKSPTSKLIFDVQLMVSRNNTDFLTMALFRAGTADALRSSGDACIANYPTTMSLRYEMISGGVAPITFSIRVGSDTPAVLYVNGDFSGAKYGASRGSSITVTEYGA